MNMYYLTEKVVINMLLLCYYVLDWDFDVRFNKRVTIWGIGQIGTT